MALVPQTKQTYKPPSAYAVNVPKKVAVAPAPKAYSALNPYGWGAATQTSNLPGHDIAGTAANPSAPTYLHADGSYSTTPPAVATPGHWSDPVDYSKFIPGDWEVTDAQAQGNKMQGEAEAAFQKSLRQAFIDYGGDSSKLGDYAKYIDDPTIQAAQNNKFSQTAQNLAAMTKSLRQQRAALAARGMEFSGANTEATRQALAAKEQNDYTGLRSFLSGADEGTSGLASVRQQIADKISAARQSAAARLAQQYQQTWVDATPGEDLGFAPPAAAAPPPKAAAFGGIVGTRTLANGATVTTYANGRQVQQAPGKSAYVIKQGG